MNDMKIKLFEFIMDSQLTNGRVIEYLSQLRSAEISTELYAIADSLLYEQDVTSKEAQGLYNIKKELKVEVS